MEHTMRLARLVRRIAPALALTVSVCAMMPAQAQAPEDKASVERISQEADDLMSALKAYGAAQREDALKKTKATLDSLDRRIDLLEARVDAQWSKMDKAAREQARNSLKALRQQRREVATWFGSMRDGSAEAWEEIKTGFAGAYQALNEAWQKTEKDVAAKEKH